MIKAVLIDDEQNNLDNLYRLLQKHCPEVAVTATALTAGEGREIILAQQPDLIFLDIQMPQINGLQFLQSLHNPPLIIMVTAYEKYAVEGFSLQVADYILKPFSFDRFLKACNRAAELFRMKGSGMSQKVSDDRDFFVNVEYTLVKIIVADIDYIEGLKDYIKIYLSSSTKPVLTRMSQKSIEAKLPAGAFIRTHKSFLVAISKITTIKRGFVCIGKREIPVSETFKENIGKVLRRLTL